MSADPKVSVILPTFNRARTLPRAMTSVLAQSERSLELIVVDDDSTDDTESVVTSVADPRVRYVRRTGNSGPAAARNAGLAVARGTFVGFQDSDDEWLPLKLEKQLAALDAAAPDVGLVLCGQLRWDTRTLWYLPDHGRTGVRSGRLRAEILRTNFALTPSWLLRRSVVERLGGFDEALSMLEDWEWLIRYTERHAAVLLDEPLMMVWESADSISLNHARYVRALETIIAKHRDALSADPLSLANLYYVLGKKYALYVETTAARPAFRKALQLWPRDPRYWAAFALSLAGSRTLFQRAWLGVRRMKGIELPRPERL
ncbi:MAG: glycosyltransferase family 2 protein [Sinimarinibacterium sp.]|jgi:glycosyltransferase involved in cell wall biosynthesis